MKRLAAISVLLIPAVYAADLTSTAPEWLPAAVDTARGVIKK